MGGERGGGGGGGICIKGTYKGRPTNKSPCRPHHAVWLTGIKKALITTARDTAAVQYNSNTMFLPLGGTGLKKEMPGSNEKPNGISEGSVGEVVYICCRFKGRVNLTGWCKLLCNAWRAERGWRRSGNVQCSL